MKLTAGRVDAFVKRPDPGIRAFLVYGPDGGLVRERADTLARHVVEDLSDPFRVTDLPGDALTADPARLADEMAAQSLMGGRRLLRVREAGEGLVVPFAALLASPPPGDNAVVVEAGELDKSSKLRALFEQQAQAVAIPCYVEDEAGLARSIRDMLKEQRLTVSSDALAFLAANLVGDRMVARGEIEKLATYMGEDSPHVELEDAQAAIGDSAALDVDVAVMAAADGDFVALERALKRLFGEGASAVALLRSAQRHFQRLHLAAARVVAGDSVEQVVDSLRPPVFFKQRPRLIAQIRRWTYAHLSQALGRLAETEADCKRTGMPDEVLCSRAFFHIARLARAPRKAA